MKSKSLSRILKEPSVVFDEAEHTYKRKDNGELYTGCTTISGAWDKSFFLGPWHAKEMANQILDAPYDSVMKLDPKEFEAFILEAKGAAKRKSEQAKLDGAAAHDWIASGIAAKIDRMNMLLPMPESEEAKKAINAFIQWAKATNIQWLASEEVVCSDEHRIGGKLDAIAIVDGLTFLVDFKTSGQLSPDYLLQAAGYDVMLQEMGLRVMGYLIVRIPKDGAEAETLTVTDQKDMQFFRETFLKQREAHKFYVYMESRFKDLNTGKMKTDAPPVEKVAEKVETNKPIINKTNGKHSEAAVKQRGGKRRGARAK